MTPKPANLSSDMVMLLEELIQTVGDKAVAILLRQDPSASALRQQMHRQAITAPIRRMLDNAPR